MVKYIIESKKKKDMEKAFTKLQENLIKHASKGVSCYWTKQPNGTYELEFRYLFQNRVAEMLLTRELKGVLKKIDPDFKLKKK